MSPIRPENRARYPKDWRAISTSEITAALFDTGAAL